MEMGIHSKKRLISLDAFRGITIIMMILVNNPGSWAHVYKPLRHASWHGWTPTDFIFPFFLFIVGVAISLVFSKRLDSGVSKQALLGKIFTRSLIIFAVGIFLNLFPYFRVSSLRIMGVLQRIALCYLMAGLIVLYFPKRVQWGITVFLLAAYWIVMKIVPVPGFGAGVLEPEGNLCWYIDKTLLNGHTWKGAPVPGFDPEGLLSTFPAVATTMLGVFTGDWIRTDRSHIEKAGALFFTANIALVSGVIMDLWFPINKNLWTSSYVVFMAGMALGSFYFGRLIDRRGDPLKIYAYLQVGIGVFAFLLPFILNGVSSIYIVIHRNLHTSFYMLSFVKFFLCFAVLIVPATLIGGALPVISKFFADRIDRLGWSIGILYAVNTFGAVLGCFSAFSCL